MWVANRSLVTSLASGLAAASMLITGCAAGPRGIVLLSGTSGPVAWEVIDVDQTGDPEQEIRWSYTLVLRGTGTTVQFQTLQTGSEGSTVTGAADTQPFAERLARRRDGS